MAQRCRRLRARFRRNGCDVASGYVDDAMIDTLRIDTRIARRELRAGRLHAGN
ncbi:hypothetical protein [Bradyrhizobium elkanii]|uniref:hypothetical protein n=1 Tax=Bradyrhizobium elkanii TaxID=29448 RepID=UPI001BAA4062|nr:hypothetical protein [Bradyrhizobium elkanii]MBR1159523.1 hypothetical protein [Bradyrhizobium elkanii]